MALGRTAFAVAATLWTASALPALAADDAENPEAAATEPGSREPVLTWWNTGVFAVPYAGGYTVLGKGGEDLGVGFRAGTFIGGWLERSIVLAGEVTVDVLNPHASNSGHDTGTIVDFAFSPLVHLPLGPSSGLFVGPKLGVATFSERVSSNYRTSTVSGSGALAGGNVLLGYGLNAGMALAAIANVQWRAVQNRCDDDSFLATCPSEGKKNFLSSALALALIF